MCLWADFIAVAILLLPVLAVLFVLKTGGKNIAVSMLAVKTISNIIILRFFIKNILRKSFYKYSMALYMAF